MACARQQRRGIFVKNLVYFGTYITAGLVLVRHMHSRLHRCTRCLNRRTRLISS
jgi:hypothetical protein